MCDLPLIEAYKQADEKPYGDLRHPILCTVSRHVISFNDYPQSSQPDCKIDTYLLFGKLFQECESKMASSWTNPPYASYTKKVEPPKPKAIGDCIATGETSIQYEPVQCRVVAVFSDEDAANKFYDAVKESPECSLPYMDLKKETFNISPQVSEMLEMKEKHPVLVA